MILLHQAHSRTAKEIAQLLGLTVTTVNMRLHRAHRKLEKIMQFGCAVSNDSQGVPSCQPKCEVPKSMAASPGPTSRLAGDS